MLILSKINLPHGPLLLSAYNRTFPFITYHPVKSTAS